MEDVDDQAHGSASLVACLKVDQARRFETDRVVLNERPRTEVAEPRPAEAVADAVDGGPADITVLTPQDVIARRIVARKVGAQTAGWSTPVWVNQSGSPSACVTAYGTRTAVALVPAAQTTPPELLYTARSTAMGMPLVTSISAPYCASPSSGTIALTSTLNRDVGLTT